MAASSSLTSDAAELLDVSDEILPDDLVLPDTLGELDVSKYQTSFLQLQGSALISHEALSKKEPHAEENWLEEHGHLVAVVNGLLTKKKLKLSDEELRSTGNGFIKGISADSKEIVHFSLLGLSLLMKESPEKVQSAIENFSDALKEALEKYRMDIFAQAILNKLLNQEEDNVMLNSEGEPFVYPPFQKALPYFPNYGYQVTLVFEDGKLDCRIMTAILDLITKLKVKCEKIDGCFSDSDSKVAHSGFNVGFELNYWGEWCKLLDREPSIPVKKATKILNSDTENFMKCHPKLKYTPGHMWLYLKADTQDDCEALLNVVSSHIDEHSFPAKKLVTKAFKKNEGKLFGGQFLDGISNAVDAISMIREVLIPPMPVDKGQISPEGGMFAFMQFFQFDDSVLMKSSQPVIENMIGRDSTTSEALARLDERSHVKRARVINSRDGTNTELLRQTLPFVPHGDCKSNGPNTKGVFFVAFGKSVERFFEILQNLLGQADAFFTEDLLLTHVHGRFGKMFYCPNTKELEELPQFTDCDVYPPIPFWSKNTSTNRAYFYNHIQYLHSMSTGYVHGDPPTKRVLYLLSKVFARWHSTWIHKFDVPRLPHLKEFLQDDEKHILSASVQERKGYSYKKMLGEVFTSDKPLPDDSGKIYGHSENFDTYRVDPKELIVGVTDRLSFGSGKEVMPYLLEGSETTLSVNLALTEFGNMGHIVPGHNYILELGVVGMLKKLKAELKQKDKKSPDQLKFYQSAVYAYEGVQLYLLKYGRLARQTAKKMRNKTTEACDRKNLREIAKRMVRLATGDPNTFSFHDAVQMIFSMHCCLHLVGQAVSVGRIDQLLISYYRKDIKNGILTADRAQEIIDAFFIKFDEHVVMSRYNIPYGHTTLGSTCVTGRGGPFPTGDSMNQWIQQITVGGYDEKGEDACNEITLMCLKSCRRLPLNAPCVSLRLTKSTPEDVKKEAAKALLSGGAHPILYNDDQMVQGLHEVLCQSFVRSGLTVPADLIQVARGYSCDGCYEPMFTGRSEFKFAYIFLLKAVIFTINSGADYLLADPLHLAGGVSSYRTPLPNDIKTFEEFKKYFLMHLKLMVEGLYGLILNSYGNPWLICPSPLLSCLLEGCVENGMDMTNGGSRFHILTPMYVGFANTVNSLYNIKHMVYDENNVVSLDTLRMALFNNWGENMVEPFYDTEGEGTIHTKMWSQQFMDLRSHALNLPKFGMTSADNEINDLATWLASEMNKLAYEALYEQGPIFDKYEELRKKYSVPGKPFLFQVMTGSGTFESYVSVGAGCAATPDGRLKGQPTASDCSPQPYPQDLPVPQMESMDIITTLKPYLTLSKHVPNGCEVDLTVPENFPIESLLEFIDAFIKGETGSNLVTVTCVDGATLERAQVEPQRFNLVRNRMGGWSNFFVSMFQEHQLQHTRRPVFGPHKN